MSITGMMSITGISQIQNSFGNTEWQTIIRNKQEKEAQYRDYCLQQASLANPSYMQQQANATTVYEEEAQEEMKDVTPQE